MDFSHRFLIISLFRPLQGLLRRNLSQHHLHHQGAGVREPRQMWVGKIPGHDNLHQGVGMLLFQDGGIGKIHIAHQAFFGMLYPFLLTLVIFFAHNQIGMGQAEQNFVFFYQSTELRYGLHLVI